MFGWIRKLLGETKGATGTEVATKGAERAEVTEGGPSPAPGRRSKRDFHLGLDWGTSTTKLVLRDYEQGDQGLAYVLCLEGAEGGYRYSSAVALREGRIYLGPKAEQKGGSVYSLKALAIGGQVGALMPEAAKLSCEDCATLYLAHVLNSAWATAGVLAGRVGAEPRLGVTLGVPTEVSWSKFDRAGMFLRMARTAYQLGVRGSFDPQGTSEDDAVGALSGARGQLSHATEIDNWLRPELAAATLWAFRSPATEPGLYSCVDVGAWTTNASFFRIRHEIVDGDFLERGGLSFYGGACRPPAMNEVCAFLAAHAGVPPETLRGAENEALKRSGRQVIMPALEGIFDTWRLGFHSSYGKEAHQDAWSRLRVLPIGGGSKVDAVRDLLKRFPLEGWDPPRVVRDLGCPRDLFQLPKPGETSREPFSGDSAFLLVAYGLSVRHGEFPPMHLADEIQPLPRPERQGAGSTPPQPRPRKGMCQQCGERPPMMGDTVCRDCGG